MSPHSQLPDPIADEAAIWLARRDRGLGAAEQDAYLDWLRADPRHPAEIARQEKAWGALDQLAEWRPQHSDRPNPDLLAVPHRRRWLWLAGLAAAAAVVFGFIVLPPAFEAAPTARVVRHSEMRTLPDGSVVELNTGADIAIDFSGPERLVRLLRGEAHFTVAKMGPERPFIVTANGVRVRAVGTVFNVRMLGDAVDVLVTEGKVRIDPPNPADPGFPIVLNAAMIEAGERASVSFVEQSPTPPVVLAASPAEIEATLSWQGLRLEFNETPLADAVEQFNRHGSVSLVIADTELADMRIGGNFRADNAEAFVRLLDGVSSETDSRGRLVLRRIR